MSNVCGDFVKTPSLDRLPTYLSITYRLRSIMKKNGILLSYTNSCGVANSSPGCLKFSYIQLAGFYLDNYLERTLLYYTGEKQRKTAFIFIISMYYLKISEQCVRFKIRELGGLSENR